MPLSRAQQAVLTKLAEGWTLRVSSLHGAWLVRTVGPAGEEITHTQVIRVQTAKALIDSQRLACLGKTSAYTVYGLADSSPPASV